jgi:hypothetical protein
MIACLLCGAVAGSVAALSVCGVWLLAVCRAASPVKVCSECGRRLMEMEKPQGRCCQCSRAGQQPIQKMDRAEDLR